MTPVEREALIEMLARRSFERRPVVLSSGRTSDYYVDCRRTTLHPLGARLCGSAMYCLYRELGTPVTAVGGPTLGADPLVVAFILEALAAGEELQGFLVRKEAKTHGMANRIEGLHDLPPRSRVLLVEDVLTTGGSLLFALEAVRQAGMDPVGAMVVVDREEGGAEALAAAGLEVHPLLKASEVIERVAPGGAGKPTTVGG